MKELYLVRHAKSSWDYESVEDYDRPLQGRGIRDAHMVSSVLAGNRETPEAIYTSPAIRAAHTAMIFSRNLIFPFSDTQKKIGILPHTKKRRILIMEELHTVLAKSSLRKQAGNL